MHWSHPHDPGSVITKELHIMDPVCFHWCSLAFQEVGWKRQISQAASSSSLKSTVNSLLSFCGVWVRRNTLKLGQASRWHCFTVAYVYTSRIQKTRMFDTTQNLWNVYVYTWDFISFIIMDWNISTKWRLISCMTDFLCMVSHRLLAGMAVKMHRIAAPSILAALQSLKRDMKTTWQFMPRLSASFISSLLTMDHWKRRQ